MSPVHPEKFIEWEYDPARCATCAWCALTFKNKWAHLTTRILKKTVTLRTIKGSLSHQKMK